MYKTPKTEKRATKGKTSMKPKRVIIDKTPNSLKRFEGWLQQNFLKTWNR